MSLRTLRFVASPHDVGCAVCNAGRDAPGLAELSRKHVRQLCVAFQPDVVVVFGNVEVKLAGLFSGCFVSVGRMSHRP